jgi:hypothetical protein
VRKSSPLFASHLLSDSTPSSGFTPSSVNSPLPFSVTETLAYDVHSSDSKQSQGDKEVEIDKTHKITVERSWSFIFKGF